MGEILPDGTIQGYEGYCQKCRKIIKTNMQGNEIGSHLCLPSNKEKLTDQEKEYLLRIKSILLAMEVITHKAILSEKDWLEYKLEGLSPSDAVKVDFGIKKINIRWSKAQQIYESLVADPSLAIEHPLPIKN